MPFDDQLWRAIADYALKFPDAGSLGSGSPPDAWLAEYQRAGRTAFASVLITASATEGGNSSGSRQFPQETLIDALHCRRFELDPTYALPPHLAQYAAERAARARGSRGFSVRLSS